MLPTAHHQLSLRRGDPNTVPGSHETPPTRAEPPRWVDHFHEPRGFCDFDTKAPAHVVRRQPWKVARD